jgi:transposase
MTSRWIAQAPAHSLPIYRGIAGRGLAFVLAATYCDHLPLYRQADVSAFDLADFDRSV